MERTVERRVVVAGCVVALQSLAAVYFLFDAMRESGGVLGYVDVLVAVALLAGVAYGAYAIRRLFDEARRRERSLAAARGALGQLARERFADWGLSRAEAEIALFVLKGCSIGEIAAMRGASSGTVRSQLSQIYAKAGVSSQSMLMSLFIDDLFDSAVLADT